ncbi:UNKNOWN [Stylonychia lemnae]|uniref:Transmembrane protein n=1 Tax=Stylonychia lemnae TaxID=5949 RepID=A0A078B417_STYLE|nr:UNKNOWN [Stylonychia lemnae]|eukprot:CDW89229.1 UNKNOWN [Stylonychia lemnae]
MRIFVAIQLHVSLFILNNLKRFVEADQFDPTFVPIIPESILIKKDIRNLIVQENEIMNLDMGNYYVGSLLDYQLDCINLEHNDISYDIQQLISIQKPFKVDYSEFFIDTQIYEPYREPFKRSSIIVLDDYGQQNYVIFLDRNLTLHFLNNQQFSSNLIYENHPSMSLDKSIINDTCADILLKQIYLKESLLIFCRSKVHSKNGDYLQHVYATVVIQEFLSNHPKIRYILYNQTTVIQDHPAGLRSIGAIFLSLSDAIFVGMTAENGRLKLCLFIYHNKIEEEMILKDETYRIVNQKDLLEVSAYIDFDEEFERRELIDMMFLPGLEDQQLVFLFENMIIICPVPKTIYLPSMIMQRISCNSDNGELVNSTNGVSLYQNPQDSNYFYVANSMPPSVMEIDRRDSQNVFPTKIYKPPNEESINVGLSTMATNNNYIIHLIQNVQSGKQILRFYNRRGNRFESVKFDYYLNENDRTNFFYFPNYYFNILQYRDENKVNLTSFFDYRITINAQNSTLVRKYEETIFACKLDIRNKFNHLQREFNLTFVGENYTIIHSIKGFNNNSLIKQDIIYNCGDSRFSYDADNFFVGPNFGLEVRVKHDDNCSSGSCYFKVQNTLFDYNFFSNAPNENCTDAFIFPSLKDPQELTSPFIYVCTNMEQNYISSFNLSRETDPNYLILTNQISFNPLDMFDYHYDLDDRAIFNIVIANEWATNQVMILFYEIESLLIWRSAQNVTNLKIFKEYDDILHIHYNQDLNYGTVLSQYGYYLANDSYWQQILVFKINFTIPELQEVVTHNFYVQGAQRQSQAALSSNEFLFTLNDGGVINIYQVLFGYYSKNLIYLRNYTLNYDDLQSFDIFDQKYLVLYTSFRAVYVFEISNQIYITYKMKLPLYEWYSQEKFHIQKWAINAITYSYYKGYLAILYESEFNDKYQKTNVLVYNIATDNQFSSLVIAQDFSFIYENGTNKDIIMFGMGNKIGAVLISTNKVLALNVELKPRIMLAIGMKANVIKKCSQLKHLVQSTNSDFDRAIIISNLSINAISFFKGFQQTDKLLKIKVYSYNEGLTITPTLNKVVSKTFSNSKGTYDSETLLLQEIVEGYSISFNLSCSYYDLDQQFQTCNQNIQENTKDVPYKFYLEFVTTNRIVIRSFTLDKFFLVFDSQGNWNLLRFEDGNLDLQWQNGRAMQNIETGRINETFGCELGNYFGVFGYQYSPDQKIFLALYQCKVDERLYLRSAFIVVFQDLPKPEDKHLNVIIFQNQYRVSFPIIDIQGGEITLNQSSKLMYTMVGVSCDIPNSFSNIFYILNLTLHLDEFKMILEQKSWASSVTQLKNTYKTGKLVSIPKSNLLVVTDSDNGAYIFDLITYQCICEIDVVGDNYFKDQYAQFMGPLKVFNAFGDWPYNIHIFTNYGIYIYTFDVNLQDRSQVFPDYKTNMKIKKKLILRIQFDQLDSGIQGNEYGYTFLTRVNTSQSTYDTYLGAVAFYSGTQSKILKLVKLGTNFECNSLNHDSFLSDSPYDQIAISFICNTQLYVVRVCTRPHLEINFVNLTQNVSSNPDLKGKKSNGPLDYNQFNITVRASNMFSQLDDRHDEEVVVIYNFQNQINSEEKIYYLSSFILLLLITIFLIIFNYPALNKANDLNGSLLKHFNLKQSFLTENEDSKFKRNKGKNKYDLYMIKDRLSTINAQEEGQENSDNKTSPKPKQSKIIQIDLQSQKLKEKYAKEKLMLKKRKRFSSKAPTEDDDKNNSKNIEDKKYHLNGYELQQYKLRRIDSSLDYESSFIDSRKDPSKSQKIIKNTQKISDEVQ